MHICMPLYVGMIYSYTVFSRNIRIMCGQEFEISCRIASNKHSCVHEYV